MKFWVVFVLFAPGVLACIVPQNGMHIGWSADFCSDVYYFNRPLVISGSNIAVNCDNAIFKSWNGNYGIVIEDSSNVTLTNCHIISYQTGIYVTNSSMILLESNHLIKNEVGTRLDLVNNSAIMNQDVSLRMPFEVIESEKNAISLLNKPVVGSFCDVNFCNQPKSAIDFFVESYKPVPVLKKAPAKTASRLYNWIFGSF